MGNVFRKRKRTVEETHEAYAYANVRETSDDIELKKLLERTRKNTVSEALTATHLSEPSNKEVFKSLPVMLGGSIIHTKLRELSEAGESE